MRIWECKIGEVDSEDLPGGSDGRMRDAVQHAYLRVTGKPPTFAFTGWGGRLTESERAVVEDREADPSTFVPEVEPVPFPGNAPDKEPAYLYQHECGYVDWFSVGQRAEMLASSAPGGCDACESGSDNPLHWSPLYRPVIR